MNGMAYSNDTRVVREGNWGTMTEKEKDKCFIELQVSGEDLTPFLL